MTKSISIVIPAFNEERLLRGCLEAIAAQTIKPSQVIVVDNNSTDGTAALARSFGFVTVVSEPQQGIVYSRNRGFDLAVAGGADIIGRIDADTVLPAGWVEGILRFYEQPGHEGQRERQVLNGGARFYNLHSGRLAGIMYDFVVHRLNRLMLGYYFPWGSNMALSAAAWREVRDDICLQTDVHEDLDLGIHLHAKGYATVYRARMRVGVVARRVMNERGRLWSYLKMWMRTMKRHTIRLWPLTIPLSAGIWVGSYALFIIESVWNVFSDKNRLTTDRVRSNWPERRS